MTAVNHYPLSLHYCYLFIYYFFFFFHFQQLNRQVLLNRVWSSIAQIVYQIHFLNVIISIKLIKHLLNDLNFNMKKLYHKLFIH